MRSKDKEEIWMNINPITVMEIEKLLNYLAENEDYMAQIGKLKIKYMGVTEDTLNGTREMFYIERGKNGNRVDR